MKRLIQHFENVQEYSFLGMMIMKIIQNITVELNLCKKATLKMTKIWFSNQLLS